MTQLSNILLLLLSLVAAVIVAKNCVCLNHDGCTCKELSSDFPTCDLCTSCGPILDACTNVINAGNVGSVGTGSTEPTLNINNQGRNCIVIDGVTVSGNINGGGNDCIRIINGGVLDGDVKGSWGSDCIEVIGQGSKITGKAEGASQEDCVRVKEGHIGEVKLGSAQDCFVAIDATIGGPGTNTAVNGQSQKDCFIISNTKIQGSVTSESDNDCIEVTQHSEITGDLDGSWGNDIVYLHRHYDDDASEEKRRRHIAKANATTSARCGVRYTGMQSFKRPKDSHDPRFAALHPDVSPGVFEFRDKYHGRTLKETDLVPEATWFFHDNIDVRTTCVKLILEKIRNLRRLLIEQHHFYFYSSSLLLVYEGALPHVAPARVDVRMIDFAHTVLSDGRRDDGYVHGIDYLIRILTQILENEETGNRILPTRYQPDPRLVAVAPTSDKDASDQSAQNGTSIDHKQHNPL